MSNHEPKERNPEEKQSKELSELKQGLLFVSNQVKNIENCLSQQVNSLKDDLGDLSDKIEDTRSDIAKLQSQQELIMKERKKGVLGILFFKLERTVCTPEKHGTILHETILEGISESRLLELLDSVCRDALYWKNPKLKYMNALQISLVVPHRKSYVKFIELFMNDDEVQQAKKEIVDKELHDLMVDESKEEMAKRLERGYETRDFDSCTLLMLRHLCGEDEHEKIIKNILGECWYYRWKSTANTIEDQGKLLHDALLNNSRYCLRTLYCLLKLVDSDAAIQWNNGEVLGNWQPRLLNYCRKYNTSDEMRTMRMECCESTNSHALLSILYNIESSNRFWDCLFTENPKMLSDAYDTLESNDSFSIENQWKLLCKLMCISRNRMIVDSLKKYALPEVLTYEGPYAIPNKWFPRLINLQPDDIDAHIDVLKEFGDSDGLVNVVLQMVDPQVLSVIDQNYLFNNVVRLYGEEGDKNHELSIEGMTACRKNQGFGFRRSYSYDVVRCNIPISIGKTEWKFKVWKPENEISLFVQCNGDERHDKQIEIKNDKELRLDSSDSDTESSDVQSGWVTAENYYFMNAETMDFDFKFDMEAGKLMVHASCGREWIYEDMLSTGKGLTWFVGARLGPGTETKVQLMKFTCY
eukprot:TRINITY_DN192055_c0_g1_i1.p1 TRINITY_DN192055_c0_g1~~TRINITY_DN192055_c0_g1_i1.p1  ORF type:complete len:640 (-),score=115.16 TRINITY_DN192055_c0_g1_i1:165-2084(-)